MGLMPLLLRLAVRNLFSSFLYVVVGGLVLLGTFLLVTGGALLDSVSSAMGQSIRGSLAGDVQVYSSRSRDSLELWGAPDVAPDLAPIDDFSRLKRTLASVPEVERVVPLAISVATLNPGNYLDIVLGDLRQAFSARQRGEGDLAALDATIQDRKALARQLIQVLRQEMTGAKELASERAWSTADGEALERASSEGFWASFDAAPFDALEFLENQVAPQMSEVDPYMVRFAGTDLTEFQQAFPNLHVVDGEPVPQGRRGLLVSKLFYEDTLKLKTARRLDLIHEALAAGKTLATDPDLQRKVEDNRTQLRDIVYQLDATRTRTLVERLQRELGSKEEALPALLASFFSTDDANFARRYAFFYSDVAPLLAVYRVKVGDSLTLKSFTRSGSVQSVRLKLYGTFEFKGLEKAALAGGVNLMDLMSFRDLYGYVTPDEQAQLDALQAAGGVRELSREEAERELFGGAAESVEAEAQMQELPPLDGLLTERAESQEDRVYTQQELDRGVVLHAAVLLKDPTRLDAGLRAISEAAKRDGWELKAVPWVEAAGMIGHLVSVARGALYFAVMVIFVVTLVVLNNALMLANLRRVQEFGTLRAIGAQRGLVLAMVLVESLVLGLVAAGLGALLAGSFIGWLGHAGIPVPSAELSFFFAGPRLFPSVLASHVVSALVLVLGVTLVSTLSPALMATRVSPLRAMQASD
ncbi:ABC transporter permease [Archangium sp.]|uniref:ABC transporter permease n=1 Tax=Archangium sp. TaxID=1872627 RepID=UPI002ED85465